MKQTHILLLLGALAILLIIMSGHNAQRADATYSIMDTLLRMSKAKRLDVDGSNVPQCCMPSVFTVTTSSNASSYDWNTMQAPGQFSDKNSTTLGKFYYDAKGKRIYHYIQTGTGATGGSLVTMYKGGFKYFAYNSTYCVCNPTADPFGSRICAAGKLVRTSVIAGTLKVLVFNDLVQHVLPQYQAMMNQETVAAPINDNDCIFISQQIITHWKNDALSYNYTINGAYSYTSFYDIVNTVDESVFAVPSVCENACQ